MQPNVKYRSAALTEGRAALDELPVQSEGRTAVGELPVPSGEAGRVLRKASARVAELRLGVSCVTSLTS